MASFKGLYDKLMSIIKIDTVVDSGVYIPSPTDIIPVYDYQNAVDSITGEKIATKKFVRATDLGGGGGSSTETILYSNLSASTHTTTGAKLSFVIPGGTVTANSMLYLEAKAYSGNLSDDSGWVLSFQHSSGSFGKGGTSSNNSNYMALIKLININAVSGSNNTVTGAVDSLNPNDYSVSTGTTSASKYTIDWNNDQTIILNLSGTLPPSGVTIQMFRIKLATETPMP